MQVKESVVIRFAGDSGDGMQVLGSQFTNTTAMYGNDLATFPDFPAEIRAPAGTLAGVSGFQLHFSSLDIFTPGDTPEVLIAMNPAALKVNIADLKPGGLLIVNAEKFVAREFEKAGITVNPLEDGSLDAYKLVQLDLGRLAKEAVSGLGLGTKEVDRCKNFFALGITYWLYNRPMDGTVRWIEAKFKDPYREANLRALQAGFNLAETMELFGESYSVPKAKLAPGTYRNILGNQATSLGLVAGAQLAGLPLFLGSYPITPASDILHQLSAYKSFNVTTFQAEDEIAAIVSAIGAAYTGALGVTTTSGPGMALKTEAMGLAIMTELPLVIINVQRGGPSTGLPTKTEQADLLQALYGRNGEAPLAIVAACTPADCFGAAVEAVRIAVTHMVPTILLTDGYLANGSEPWAVPNVADLPKIPVQFRTDPDGFQPYARNPDTLARAWVKPGTPGLEHRIGGIEKDALTGAVSYDAENHQTMCLTRAAKIAAIKVPDLVVEGDEGELLVVGWGSTYGAIHTAIEAARGQGIRVAQAHFRHLNPMPANTEAVLRRFKRVIVPEMNLGQLVKVLRSEYLIDCKPITKIKGQAFKVSELLAAIVEHSAAIPSQEH